MGMKRRERMVFIREANSFRARKKS
jgi:hypothetical protein